MPPKNIPQRRSREETLQEDLVKLLDEENTNDKKVLSILKDALREGVDVNLVVAGRTLICHFAFYGMRKCFDECFLRGADPTIFTPEDPDDALVSAVAGIASAETSLRMVGFLLNHMKANELNLNEAVELACANCQFEVVRLLLRRNNSFADKVLPWGVHRGSRQLVEIALDFNASVNQIVRDGRYLIHKAAQLQDSSILQKLVDAGANIETKNESTNETPLHVAVRFNSVSCVKFLVGKNCEFSSYDTLLLAVHCRSHDVLKELLRNEVSLYEQFETHVPTLLFAAVAQDDLTAFKIMYPIPTFSVQFINQLVRLEKYDMLSAALFEFEHPGLSTKDLAQLVAEAPNDDFKKLLRTKIDAMNGVDLVAKVKKEAIKNTKR